MLIIYVRFVALSTPINSQLNTQASTWSAAHRTKINRRHSKIGGTGDCHEITQRPLKRMCWLTIVYLASEVSGKIL